MQTDSLDQLKERYFYFPASFETLEEIIRNGFTPGTGEYGLKFYPDSEVANSEIHGKDSFILKLNRSCQQKQYFKFGFSI